MAEKDIISPEGEIDMKEFKKLSPEVRLKKLKELKAKKDVEIQNAEKLIKESIIEIERDEKIRKIPRPEQKIVDLEKLFDFRDKDEVKKTEDKIKEDALKEAMENEMIQAEKAQGNRGNYQMLRVEDLNSPNSNLYQLSGQIYSTLKEISSMEPKEFKENHWELLEAIIHKIPQLQVDKSYTTAEYVLDRLSASRKILKDIGKDYQGV